MNDNAAAILGGLIVFAVLGGIFWWEASLWSECRAVHSWFYCLRVLHP